MIDIEEKYMARCIEIARNGEGFTAPNPMVGAVIIYKGEIIGEGFHRKWGGPHAEVNAIASVKNESQLCDSMLYVSLEPCSHYGKTPPCANLIIEKHIPNVVVGCLDPFPEVSGRGVRMLQNAGVKVVTGVMQKEAFALNKTFMTFQILKRPYIYLKWAESADGFIDIHRNDASQPPVILSSPETMRTVHHMRSKVAAVLVGTYTALLDNPSLTVRHWTGDTPVRLFIDRTLRIPSHYHLLDGSVKTIVFTEKDATDLPNIEFQKLDFKQNILPQIMQQLYQRNLNSLLVEGGTILLQSFINANLWDEIRKEIAPVSLGSGVKAPNFKGSLKKVELNSNQMIQTFESDNHLAMVK
ncbi:MAG: bifunctional diaminohydroxyphosphoribosylaminopyrimidine deaminase/5-amino-6-(5-phosphoribosylamino)uracil reductase RibD [Parabacteroides sp.]|nr:bifunctional diaminohydroxyphosphoribosylaminopyrimidine deaminase/5-amino-6-(5-phosphoribosylamino)uracil reductase RibD [Parabacteroides sp.]